MHDIDCHIIVYQEPQWKIDRCMASFDGQAVNVHLVKGEDEYPPVKGRARGFAMGSAPYVCYADPDDWVEPNAFELLNAHLGKADVVHGWENVIRHDGVLVLNTSPHHVFVVSRTFTFDVQKEARGLLAAKPSIFEIQRVIYTWDKTP